MLCHRFFPIGTKDVSNSPHLQKRRLVATQNYRPINILHDFSKLFEISIYNRLNDFLTKCNIINKYQFGFQKQSGTLSAVTTLLDDIKHALDSSNRKICACLFLDVSKAFDTIPHNILIGKMYRYGIRGKAGDLIKSYLSNRMQCVSIGEIKSTIMNISYGTPQGSTVGPVIFLLYINDIFKLKLNGKIILFADDAAIIYTNNNIASLNDMINEDLITLHNWFIENKLTLNLNKSKSMIFHPLQNTKQYKLNLNLNGNTIEQVEQFRYLGITLQENLRWDVHIKTITSKISSIAGIMKRFGKNVDGKTLISMYHAYVNSHISYMSPVWGNSATQIHINNVQVAQNQALRSIFRKDYYVEGLSTEEIRVKYNLLSVRQNVQYNTALLAFKIKRGLIKTDIQINTINNVHSHNTRSTGNIYQASFRTNSGKTLTARLIAIEFNNLPNEIKNSQSIFAFRKRLKIFLLTNS